MKDTGVNAHSYGLLLFDKETRNTQWKNESSFKKCCWYNCKSTCRRMQIDPLSIILHKLKSKWINTCQHKTRYIEPNTRENGGNSLT